MYSRRFINQITDFTVQTRNKSKLYHKNRKSDWHKAGISFDNSGFYLCWCIWVDSAEARRVRWSRQ